MLREATTTTTTTTTIGDDRWKPGRERIRRFILPRNPDFRPRPAPNLRQPDLRSEKPGHRHLLDGEEARGWRDTRGHRSPDGVHVIGAEREIGPGAE